MFSFVQHLIALGEWSLCRHHVFFLKTRSLQNGPLRGLRIVQNVAHTAWAANKLFNHFSKKQGRSKLIRTFKNFIVKQAKRTDPPLYCAPSCPAIISFFNSKPGTILFSRGYRYRLRIGPIISTKQNRF